MQSSRVKIAAVDVKPVESGVPTSIEVRADLLVRLLKLTLAQIGQQAAVVEKHAEANGDTFVRDSDGKVVRDAHGLPICLPLPCRHSQQVTALKALFELHDEVASLAAKAKEKASPQKVEYDFDEIFRDCSEP